MDLTCHQFFTDASFTKYQNGQGRRCDNFNLFFQAVHGSTLANHFNMVTVCQQGLGKLMLFFDPRLQTINMFCRLDCRLSQTDKGTQLDGIDIVE